MEKRKNIAPELGEKLTDHYNIVLLGQQLENEIQTRMEACFENFKMELFMKSNGACSNLFTGDIKKDLPKLKLNYQNINQTL